MHGVAQWWAQLCTTLATLLLRGIGSSLDSAPCPTALRLRWWPWLASSPRGEGTNEHTLHPWPRVGRPWAAPPVPAKAVPGAKVPGVLEASMCLGQGRRRESVPATLVAEDLAPGSGCPPLVLLIAMRILLRHRPWGTWLSCCSPPPCHRSRPGCGCWWLYWG